jgi:pimeloyl-ACP methyl ester carboxylesterase
LHELRRVLWRQHRRRSALVAASRLHGTASAVVSRGGRADLALDFLPMVKAPTLLIVGSLDAEVVELNRQALAALRCEKQLIIVPGATHLFPEPGALQQVANHASSWFARHLCDAPAETTSSEHGVADWTQAI